MASNGSSTWDDLVSIVASKELTSGQGCNLHNIEDEIKMGTTGRPDTEGLPVADESYTQVTVPEWMIATKSVAKPPKMETKLDDRTDIFTVAGDEEKNAFILFCHKQVSDIMKRQEENFDVIIKKEREEWKREREESEEKMKALQEEVEAIKTLMKCVTLVERIQPSPLDTEKDAPPQSQEELVGLVSDDAQPEVRNLRKKNLERLPSRSNKWKSGLSVYKTEAPADDMHVLYGESSFTLIYLHEVQSHSFVYGLIIFVLQISTITLALVDMIDFDSTENPLQLPPMVDLAVTVSQALSLFTSLAMQSDLIEAVMKLQDQYHSESRQLFPGATYSKWLFSCVAQMLSGLLLMTASFVLTMQSDSVIGVMLNFTALHFMAGIDDLGFAMAKMGFITTQLQQEAEAVVDFEVPKRSSSSYQRHLLYFLSLVGLFTGYAILKGRQVAGSYLPTFVYVQFGDAYNPKLPYFSGILTSGNVGMVGYREYRDLGTGKILLSYCYSEKAWTFSERDQPCDFFAVSSETTSYDVTITSDSEWRVKDSIGRLHPFDTFSLVNRDCNPSICLGLCNSGVCECPNYQFGMDCEFFFVCTRLVIDARFKPFLPMIQEIEHENILDPVDNEYEMLKNPATNEFVRVHDMPVYYSNQTSPANIIFFGGRRWIITSESQLLNWTQAKLENPGKDFFPEKTALILENDFHAHDGAHYTPLYMSNPVDFETPDFQPTPSGLGWWTVRAVNDTSRLYEPDYAVEAILSCETCLADQGGFCNSAGGTCNLTTGLCDCNNLYYGHKCEMQEPCYKMEYPCSGHGSCSESSGECRCDLPWYGKLCEFKYLCTEEYGSCRNGGVCNVTSQDRCGCEEACDCGLDPAVGGSACEMFKDCRIHGCANGGFCGRKGKCFCRPPFNGILCNLVENSQYALFCTQHDDCANGSCNVTTGICTCEDAAKYGTLCEHVYSCSLSGCLNGGVCNISTGVCVCPEPYSGPDCSQEPACYSDSYCEDIYGPESVCDMDRRSCVCSWDSTVKRCQTWLDHCKERGCSNGGFCNQFGYCECPYPHTGSECDYVLEDSLESDGYSETAEACIQEFGFPPYNETNYCL